MTWLPASRLEVVNEAVPSLKVPVPIGVPPSRNVTVPVGVPAPGGLAVTSTMNVTARPATRWPGAALTTTIAAGLRPTTWLTGWLAEPRNEVSPP
jgi:hypothetical protein